MSQPGWYSDPSGQPGQFRYWDGARWSQQTTADPARTPTPDAGGAAATTGRGLTGWLIGGVVVLLAVALGVWAIFGRGSSTIAEDDNSSTPTVSQWDETSTPSETPTPSDPENSGGSKRTCPLLRETRGSQAEAGHIKGGGLSYAEVPGWSIRSTPLVDWAEDQGGQTTQVFKLWIAGIVVGQVNKADFGDPKTAVSRIFSCEASSQYYPGYQGHDVVSTEPIEIDGRQGYRLIGNVRDNHYAEVKGDRLDIIAIDVGREGKLAIYKGMAPIDGAEFQQRVDEATKSLKVEG